MISLYQVKLLKKIIMLMITTISIRVYLEFVIVLKSMLI
jgi:hypothetical protein